MKICKRCNQEKPFSEFGRNSVNLTRGACDGLNIRCKKCVNEMSDEHRASKRAMKAARAYIRRKGDEKARPIWMTELTPHEAVMMAVRRGLKTQEEIRKATRLSAYQVSEQLALLWDADQLDRESLRNREYVLRAA